jgi:hypothetical protein
MGITGTVPSDTMTALPQLSHLFGAYLHQDWGMEFSSCWEAVQVFRDSLTVDELVAAIHEVRTLLSLDDVRLNSKVFEELGLGYWSHGDELEVREWLILLAVELGG